MNAPTTDYEALVLALTLALTAPTDQQTAKAVTMAEQIAAGLDRVSVERAKREALTTAGE